MKTAEAIVKVLEDSGVHFIFGIPGSQTTPFYDALFSSRIKHVLTRHEQAAAYMADAFAKFTGHVGFCDGTGGPGATNLLTGIATAWIDRSPIIALTGQQPLAERDKGGFQQVDHVGLFRPIVKESVQMVQAGDAAATVRRALVRAASGRPGPVHLDIPVEIQRQEVKINEFRLGGFKPICPGRSSAAIAARAAALLVDASNPIIIAGGGAHYSGKGATDELMALAEYLAAPVVTTFNGRGIIPEDHDLSGGRIGVHARPYTDRLLQSADVVLSIGCRFSALSTRHWRILNPTVKLIQVDVDYEEIGRNYPVAIGIVGDAAAVLTDILADVKVLTQPRSLSSSPIIAELRNAKVEWVSYCEKFLKDNPAPIKPQRLCLELRRFYGRNTVFTMDAGNHKMWAAMFLDIYAPRTWIQSGAFGPMGYGLPAAVACKLADGSRDVVAVTGDGGFVMTMYELATLLQEGIAVTICIMDDGALGTIKHQQRRDYGGRYIASSLVNPDFVKLAEAYRCYGERVDEPSQIRGALEKASSAVRGGTSAVIDVVIDGYEPLPP